MSNTAYEISVYMQLLHLTSAVSCLLF